MGMVSLWFLVTITVLLSTRATSFGSVRASQLQAQQEVGTRADGKEGGGRGELFVPVVIFGKLLHHPFLLQTCQDIGCFLRRPRHHVHVGGLTFFHRSLHEVRHRRRQRGDGGQGTDADACPEAAVSERGIDSQARHSSRPLTPLEQQRRSCLMSWFHSKGESSTRKTYKTRRIVSSGDHVALK